MHVEDTGAMMEKRAHQEAIAKILLVQAVMLGPSLRHGFTSRIMYGETIPFRNL